MKIILTKDIGGLGKEGETLEVSDGYARNYLIPRGVGVASTSPLQKFYEEKRKKILEKAMKEKEAASELSKKLEALDLTIKVDAHEEGKLFGSVTSADIAFAIEKASGIEIEKRKIDLAEHIKMIGTYEIQVKLHPEVISKIKFKVEAK